MKWGDRVGAYEIQDRAPVEYIHGSRVRDIGGRLVPGSWSDPWWAWAPGAGWAVVKRWQSKACPPLRDCPAVPALDEWVTEPWQPPS